MTFYNVTDPNARPVFIQSLAFENANLGCKKVLWPLKLRSAPTDEWILHTMNIETFDYNTESWVGKTISKGTRRHQNAKCLNCGTVRHLRKDYRQEIPRNNVSSRNGKKYKNNLLGYVEGVAKADIEPMRVDQQKTYKAT